MHIVIHLCIKEFEFIGNYVKWIIRRKWNKMNFISWRVRKKGRDLCEFLWKLLPEIGAYNRKYTKNISLALLCSD